MSTTIKQQVPEISLQYSSNVPKDKRIQLANSAQAFDVFWDYWDKGTLELQESLWVMLLNANHEILGVQLHSKGGLSATTLDLRHLLGLALKANAPFFVLAHNHPAGSITPSESDLALTKKVQEGAKMVDLALRDHLIISPFGYYYSFAEKGLL